MLKGVNLYLIGMMGAGKTTIGRLLAEQLDYNFIDTDEFIQQATKQTVSHIFTESGEEVFRQLETEVLAQRSPETHTVFATGGGIVLKRENWSYLHHGVVVWLDVPLDQLYERLQDDHSRPLLQGTDLKERLKMHFEQRHPLYAQADVRVTAKPSESLMDLTNRVLNAIAQELQKKIAAQEELDRLNRQTPFQIQNN